MRAEFYRTRAAECEEAANTAADPKVRETYSELAKQWRELARQNEDHVGDHHHQDDD